MIYSDQVKSVALVLLLFLAGAGWLRSYSTHAHAQIEAKMRTEANAQVRALERQTDCYQDELAAARETEDGLRTLAVGLRAELERHKYRADSAAICAAEKPEICVVSRSMICVVLRPFTCVVVSALICVVSSACN